MPSNERNGMAWHGMAWHASPSPTGPCALAARVSPERKLDQQEGEEDWEDEARHGVQHGHDRVHGRVLDEHAAK